ncbi:MAG: anhydro-N-acetylmuramic acid kinase [Fulvivirga sp.]|uniref:anhydro-N-acetylmuramic acid kinase n=1 Tax=Fulvivirga sp. TaxID=1931237 RepID=UPI0032EC4E79
MKNNSTYRVLGVMSGTSLDGLDLAICNFTVDRGVWNFKIVDAKTIAYPKEILQKLSSATHLSGIQLKELDNELGEFIGLACKNMLRKSPVDFIASHGHTVFHQPEKALTLQIGNGQIISALCNLPVVYDFRSLDVALSGQGAPLVPLVDKALFSKYDFCLNLGGIANISFDQDNMRIAYDVVPCNMIMNTLANKLGKSYDEDGNLASEGKVIDAVLKKWNALKYYHTKSPKTLGYEYVSKNYFHDFDCHDVNDMLATSVAHIAGQIKNSMDQSKKTNAKMLVTGGGAKNNFLITILKGSMKDVEIVVPETTIIDFKEAMAFAFLGVKKVRGEVNVLASVSGASRDSSSGVMVGFLG